MSQKKTVILHLFYFMNREFISIPISYYKNILIYLNTYVLIVFKSIDF